MPQGENRICHLLFLLSWAVTRSLHVWGPDTDGSPEISGTFWLGHLDSLSVRFFDFNKELLIATFLYTYSLGTAAYGSPHLIYSCHMEN